MIISTMITHVQYLQIITCNTESKFKVQTLLDFATAKSLARNQIETVWWEALCWW